MDVKPFLETYRAGGAGDGPGEMRATRAGHVLSAQPSAARQPDAALIARPSGASPSGNTVSLEMELLEAIDADRAHNRAVTIYQTALGILRASLKAGR